MDIDWPGTTRSTPHDDTTTQTGIARTPAVVDAQMAQLVSEALDAAEQDGDVGDASSDAEEAALPPQPSSEDAQALEMLRYQINRAAAFRGRALFARQPRTAQESDPMRRAIERFSPREPARCPDDAFSTSVEGIRLDGAEKACVSRARPSVRLTLNRATAAAQVPQPCGTYTEDDAVRPPLLGARRAEAESTRVQSRAAPVEARPSGFSSPGTTSRPSSAETRAPRTAR